MRAALAFVLIYFAFQTLAIGWVTLGLVAPWLVFALREPRPRAAGARIDA
jgi:hypothetical protein